jgi:hypothetical protein
VLLAEDLRVFRRHLGKERVACAPALRDFIKNPNRLAFATHGRIPIMNEKTFAELYCEQRGLSPEAYDAAVLRETLYPHARLLAPLFKLIWSRHFSSDIEFVRSVSPLRRYREFFNETEEYAHHPENRGFWRMTANVRISSRRMRRLVRATLHADSHAEEGEEHSAVPFGGVQPAKKESHPASESSRSSA